MACKNVLIVFAHPEHKSLNGAILDTTVTTLTSQGHKVTVSDLYQMGFNPVIGKHDIKGNLKDPEKFSYLAEIASAHAEGRVSDVIRAEQEKLDAADLVIFQFPMQWMSFPAILKGWFDKVVHIGYAFSYPYNVFNNATFKGKKAVLSATLGSAREMTMTGGMMGDINVHLWPMQNGLLRFIGFDILAPNLVYKVSPAAFSEEAGKKAISEWCDRLKTIWSEETVKCCDLEDYNGFSLKDEIVNKHPYGLSVGQHCGKLIPPDSQTTAQTRDSTL